MATLTQSTVFCVLISICMLWEWSDIEAAPVAQPKPFVADLDDIIRLGIHNKHHHERTKRSNRDRAIQWELESGRRYPDRHRGDDSDDDSRQSSSNDDSDESSERRSPGDGQWYTDRTAYRYRYRGSNSDPRFPSSYDWRHADRSGERNDDRGYYGGSSRGHGGRSRGHGGRSRGHGGRSRGHGRKSRGHGGRSRGHGGRSRGRHSRERYGDTYGDRSGERSYSHSYSTRNGDRYGTGFADRYGDSRDSRTSSQSGAGREDEHTPIIF